ncbi:MAG: trypsin [Candidatus Electrothrix sp. AUS1_2]|nr:trypsin [Candidatus Electrothrix sp. AUS1_2]
MKGSGVKITGAAEKSTILWAIFGALFFGFFLYIIYAADQGTLPFFIRRLYMFPGGDKVGHFILLGIASFFANQVLYPRHFLVFGKVFFVGSLIVLVAITAEEISQMFIVSRTFDLIDLSCSYLGVIAGDVAVRVLKRKQDVAV